MKKIYSFILTALLLSTVGVGNAWGTLPTKIYVKNIYQNGYWWDQGDNTNVYAYFTDETNHEWSKGTLISGVAHTSTAIYEISVPSTHTWTKMIITRGTTSDWGEGKTYNQTKDYVEGNLPTTTNNFLIKYYQSNNATDPTWKTWNSTTTEWCLWTAANSWASGISLVKPSASATYAFASVTVSSTGTYEFQFRDEVINYMKADNVTITSSDWKAKQFSTDYGNDKKAQFTVGTGETGTYLFVFDFSSNQVSVIYPHSRSISSGCWGTICLPVGGTISGATLYSIAGKDGTSTLYLTPEGNTLVAGMPYIFKSSASTQTVTFSTTGGFELTPLSEGSVDTKGLHGRFVDQSFYNWNTSTVYIVRDEEIQMAATGSTNYSGVKAYRAFIELNDVDTYKQAPGRPIVTIPFEENNTTSVEEIEASEKAVKFFENGQLFIQKNGVVYDMTGRVLR